MFHCENRSTKQVHRAKDKQNQQFSGTCCMNVKQGVNITIFSLFKLQYVAMLWNNAHNCAVSLALLQFFFFLIKRRKRSALSNFSTNACAFLQKRCQHLPVTPLTMPCLTRKETDFSVDPVLYKPVQLFKLDYFDGLFKHKQENYLEMESKQKVQPPATFLNTCMHTKGQECVIEVRCKRLLYIFNNNLLSARVDGGCKVYSKQLYLQ